MCGYWVSRGTGRPRLHSLISPSPGQFLVPPNFKATFYVCILHTTEHTAGRSAPGTSSSRGGQQRGWSGNETRLTLGLPDPCLSPGHTPHRAPDGFAASGVLGRVLPGPCGGGGSGVPSNRVQTNHGRCQSAPLQNKPHRGDRE